MKRALLSIFLTAILIAVVFSAVPKESEAAGAVPGGMVSCWTFDEGAGGTAGDSVGTNPGTIYGARWTTGIVDGALEFDGTGGYVSVPASVKAVHAYCVSCDRQETAVPCA